MVRCNGTYDHCPEMIMASGSCPPDCSRDWKPSTEPPRTELVYTGDGWERLEAINPEVVDPCAPGFTEVHFKRARDLAGRTVWSLRDGSTVRNFTDRDFRSHVLFDLIRYSSDIPNNKRVRIIIEPQED